tara:strand:+ start:128 stop:937 length:810 start_codon:yes stop_codon:yes gene_type:complete
MRRFKGYISEMAQNMKVSDLDSEFIARATKVRSFNLKGSDFESLKHKSEIQHLYATYQFPGFDLGTTGKGLDLNRVNKGIDKLKSIDRSNFNALYDFQPKGVGPGEALLYFLVDDAVLGGGTSAGIDVKVGGSNFEVKAANISGDKKSVFGFRLGGTVDVTKEVNELVRMKEELGFTTSGKGKNEVNKTQLLSIQQKFPRDYKRVVDSYIGKAYKYLSANPVIFFNNNRSTGGRLTTAAGNLIAVKNVKRSDVMIDVVTQGGIKPKVKL